MSKQIRNDGWNRTTNKLTDILDAIPFTTTQRTNINDEIDKLAELFYESNEDEYAN